MKKIYTLPCLFISIILCGRTSNAQNTMPSTQLWTEVDFSGKINDKLVYQLDLQYSRQSDWYGMAFAKYNQQLTIRPWLHYYPKKKLRLSALQGYGTTMPYPK